MKAVLNTLKTFPKANLEKKNQNLSSNKNPLKLFTANKVLYFSMIDLLCVFRLSGLLPCLWSSHFTDELTSSCLGTLMEIHHCRHLSPQRRRFKPGNSQPSSLVRSTSSYWFLFYSLQILPWHSLKYKV